MAMPLRARTRRMPVREKRVLTEGEGSTRAQLVFCSTREQAVPLGVCTECPHLVASPQRVDAGAVVTCAPPTRRLDASDFSNTARFDVAEAAAHTLVGEVLAPCAVFVTVEAGLDSALELLEEGAECVPIVDAEGKLAGVVRPHDVLGTTLQTRARDWPPSPRRLDAVRESMAIGLAFAVLADSGHGALPVVNESGTVVGILSALDLTRWVARRMGHVLDGHPHHGKRAP